MTFPCCMRTHLKPFLEASLYITKLPKLEGKVSTRPVTSFLIGQECTDLF